MGLFAGLTRIRTRETATTSKRINKKSMYRGVQVNGSRAGCCEAVQAIAGKRFLSDEVPKLPLSGCDASDCRCSYELFEDRRTEFRRGSDVAFDIASQLCREDNRNGASSGRRSDD